MLQVVACENCLSEDLRVELIQGPTDPECGYADSADFFTCVRCGHTSFDHATLDVDDDEEPAYGAALVGGAVLVALAMSTLVLLPLFIFP